MAHRRALPFGTPVHAPWALAINARLRERYGVEASAVASDDGIVLRVPDSDAEPPGAEVVLFEVDEIENIVTTEVGGSALFASRFRECAARALLLPRRDPGRRSPLWQQRQRSAQLLEVAVRYPSFPIVLEAVREVLQDVYDLPGLLELLRRLDRREVRIVEVSPEMPSPFARNLLFGYVAQFVYEGDSPIAERRAAALSLDQGLLAELLGRAELRELLDPDVLTEVESELQRLAPDRRARSAEGVADLLRLLGPLTEAEIAARSTDDPTAWLAELRVSRRAVDVLVGGVVHVAAVEDIGRLRDALGVPVPPGVPQAFLDPVADPLGDLVSRHARTHGPFRVDEVATRFGLGTAVVRHALSLLAARGRVLEESSARRARARSGVTPTYSAGCDADRWPSCVTRSSPLTTTCWQGSCPPGSSWSAPGAPLEAVCAALTACSPRWSSWPAARCRRRRWNP
nr:crosslink repair DNA glycosylase YcaQ family protein [Nocardioides alcanivorans]